jgi:hypothetical protein
VQCEHGGLSSAFADDFVLLASSCFKVTEFSHIDNVKNSVVLVRKRTIPTERPQPAAEVSANFS